MLPIFGPNGQRFGVIIINTDVETLIGQTLDRINPAYEAHIFNHKGDTFYFDPVRQTGAFHFAADGNDEIAEFVERIQSDPLSLNHQFDGVLMVAQPLVGFGGEDGLELDVVLSAPRSKLVSGLNSNLSDDVMLVLCILAAGVGLMTFFADRMTDPLRRMAERITLYGQWAPGQKLELPTKQAGEVGELARSFTDLVSKLEDSQSRTSNIVRHAVDGLIVIDANGKIETFNPACEKMFGYGADEVVGKNITVLMSPAYATHHDEYLGKYEYTGKTSVIGKGREVLAQRKNGEEFNVEISVSEFKQGGRKYFSGTVRDMTDSKKAQFELAMQKETLEFALDGGELGFWKWNLDTGSVDFCHRSAALVGLTTHEMPKNHSSWDSLVDPMQKERVARAFADYVKGKSERFREKFRMRHKTKGWVWIQSTAAISRRHPDGKVLEIVGIHQDVTREKESEKEIAKQKETLELALAGGDLGLWDWDVTTDKVSFSERWAAMVGYRKSELAEDFSTWERLVEPDDLERTAGELKQFVEGEIPGYEVEFRMRHKDGHWVWVQSKGKIFERDTSGKPTRIVGVHIDVSDRKIKELEIRDQNRQLEMAEAVADMGHWSLDGETGEVEWSDGIFHIHGLDPAHGVQDLKNAINMYHPDDREIVDRHVKEALETGKPFDFQLRIIRADGEIRHVSSRGEGVRDEANPGRIDVFGIFQDVTEKVLSETRLKEHEDRTLALLSNIVDGVLTIDEEGVIDSCNAASARIFGSSVEELEGSNISEMIPLRFRSSHFDRMKRLAESVEENFLDRTIEMIALRRNGEEFPLEIAVSRQTFDGEIYYAAICRDITERKQVETMKTEFVSTVNHELRTPLTSVYGSLDILKHLTKGKLDDKSDRLLKLAHDGCGRLSNLINDILDVEKIAAGKMEYRHDIVGFRSLIDSIIASNEGLAGRYNVRLIANHSIDDEQVRLDPNRFTQALVNLLSNAAKFSPEGADVEIETKRLGGSQVRVSVKDHGGGIPKNFQDRIFERFAQADGSSTKKNTAGTGLGLNITKSIIEAFDGKVSFETEEGVGTVFSFDLPVHSQEARLHQAS